MKSSPEIYHLKNEFDEFLSHKNEEEKFKHEAQMLMFDCLSEIQKIMDSKKMKRKTLAEKIRTSGSYLTQLFRGDKPLNFYTIAKCQHALDIQFKIRAYPKDSCSNFDVLSQFHTTDCHDYNPTKCLLEDESNATYKYLNYFFQLPTNPDKFWGITDSCDLNLPSNRPAIVVEANSMVFQKTA